VDERAFIETKQPGWTSLSETLEKVRKAGPKSLSREELRSLGARYRAVVSDLSFARSQGASPGLVGYLNELAGRAHGALYASSGPRLSGLSSFLIKEFPAIFRSTFRYTLIAALVFFLGWSISAVNPEIADHFMPTKLEKPAGGKAEAPKPEDSPLAEIDPGLISSFIMTNNINVGITAFAGGVTAGAYTIFELAKNGLVIGAVATKAAPVMGPVRFWSFILPHGVIELMAIFICGGGGLMFGWAIIAPGNLRRSDALRAAGRTAIRMFGGAVVFFVIAGIIEGFITPASLPAWFKLMFAGLTAVALVAYLGLAGRQQTSQVR